MVKEIKEALLKHGFKLIRQSKHAIYSNGERNVTIPRGSGASRRTIKAVIQQIEGRGPFFQKQQSQGLAS